jgi:hypothetical protein
MKLNKIKFCFFGTLAANEYTTARDMAVATDRVWDLRQSAPTAAVAAAIQPRKRSASPRQRGRNPSAPPPTWPPKHRCRR